jgi:Flp pilus assembly protein TadG
MKNTRKETATSGSTRLRKSAISRGQGMVEFAMIVPLALVVMLLGVQFALIGQAALSVSQASSALARYAAVHPGALGTENGSVKASAMPAAAQNLVSASIRTDGGNDLTVNIASTNTTGGGTKPFVDQVTVTLSYDAAAGGKIALPNPFMHIPPLFNGISFPNLLGSSDVQMYEN